MKFSIGATIRNEGPFLLEWLAWQKMLGFDDVVFMHNDTTDHSVEMLQCLAEAGWCHEQEHFPKGHGLAPVRSGLNALHVHPAIRETDWLFICDIDEYLIPGRGDGTVQDLIGDMHERYRGLAVQWRCFGTADIEMWRDEYLHRMFLQSAEEAHPANKFYKCFQFQPSQNFKTLTEHAPRRWIGAGRWGEGPNRWGHIADRSFGYNPDRVSHNFTKTKWISHKGAQLNHYITKSKEQCQYKAGRPSATRKHYFDRYTPRFFELHNRNEERDEQALFFEKPFDAMIAKIRAVNGVMRLHHLCCCDHLVAMHERFKTDVKSDPRYTHHLEQANALT